MLKNKLKYMMIGMTKSIMPKTTNSITWIYNEIFSPTLHEYTEVFSELETQEKLEGAAEEC